MTCYSPIVAYASAVVNPSGKRSMQFQQRGSFSGIRQMLPCGNCIGCRLERSRIWAVRCMHEAKMHDENTFVTLTYRTEELPQYGTLVLRDLQTFFKRLRWHVSNEKDDAKVRYYACGEYGDENLRPHYHALVFGYDFRDKRFYSETAAGALFTSDVLDELWGHGECKIGSVTFDSAAYVARYCLKKVNGKLREAGHYLVHDSDGVVFERLPEFAVMSRRPGIGTPYYEKYGKEIRDHDTIVVNGKETQSIRYYDLKFEALDPSGFEHVKKMRRPRRVEERRRYFLERKRDRVRVKEVLQLKRMKEFRRTV